MNKCFLKTIVVIFIFTLYLAMPSDVFAHGEDKPGPHGGEVRMPGGFHTEVVPIDETSFKVYLLDISFSDPMTANSRVTASLGTKKSKIEIRCEAESDFFICNLPEMTNLLSGELELQASRNNVQGPAMRYLLPFEKKMPAEH